jgi:hypothetical protein
MSVIETTQGVWLSKAPISSSDSRTRVPSANEGSSLHHIQTILAKAGWRQPGVADTVESTGSETISARTILIGTAKNLLKGS